MRCVQQILMAQTATRTLSLVRVEDPLSEILLVESIAGQSRYVLPSACRLMIIANIRRCALTFYEMNEADIVNRNRKSEICLIIINDEHRPNCQVLARHNPMEIDKGESFCRGYPQPDVVAVLRIGSAVAISEESVRIEGIIIRTMGSGRNG
jgi:hypothetical protein